MPTDFTLPTITVPAGVDAFLAEGHAIDEDSVYAQVPYATGHSRTRPLWTVSERVVPVSVFVEAEQLAAMDDWYENTLLAGAEPFAAEIRNQGPGTLWWRARWIDYQSEMLHSGCGLVSGTLFIVGNGHLAGPGA